MKKVNSYNGWNSEKLHLFSEEIANMYDKKLIRFPIHLCGGKLQSYNLIKIFKKYKIKKTDYILSTWRNSWHWLLSGRSSEELKKQIRTTGSMHIYDKNFLTSAIVGGIAPIAVGIAMGLKRKKSKRRVFVFLGCMASHCGIVKESIEYSEGHDLPILFIIENNDRSVYTCTSESWGKNKKKNKVIEYFYKPKYKHHSSRLESEKSRGLF